MCTRYEPPILACSSNVPCFTANRERRRAAAQLTAQENARYKDSYLRAFDPARPLHLESWVQRDMQKGFTDELQRLRPARCQFCGERWFNAQTPTQAGAVAEGQYPCDRCKRDKKPVKSCVWKGIQGLFGPVTRAMKDASPSRPLRRPGVPRVTTEATRHVNKYPWPYAGR